MRPPDFFASSRRFHPHLPSFFPARLLLSPPHTGTPLRFSLFPARSRPRPRNLPLRPSPAEKFPQRTAAPRSAPLFPPAAGTFRSALSPPKSPRNAPPHPAPPA